MFAEDIKLDEPEGSFCKTREMPTEMGNTSRVMIPQEGADCWYDVEPGFMVVDWANVPAQLPICINDQTIAGWYIDMYVVGEYAPEETLLQKLEVWQIDKAGNQGAPGRLWKQGEIDINWQIAGWKPSIPTIPEIYEPGICEYSRWRGYLVNPSSRFAGELDQIDLWSNHIPDAVYHYDGCDDLLRPVTTPIPNPIDCSWMIDPNPAYNDTEGLGKEVLFTFKSEWSGCLDASQRFVVISLT